MFRRGVGTMVLTERMQALGDHARSSNQRLIAERREEREQNSRDDESHGQENRGQLIFDQEIRDQESRAANARGETIMLETAVSMPSPPEVSPAEDVIIIESIATFLAVDEPAPERVAESTSTRAPAPDVATSTNAPRQTIARENRVNDDGLAARSAIIHEWQNWSALNSDELADPNVAAYFFRHLETRKPKLLDFAAEDKMQAVRGWLLSERCIKA